MVAIGCAILVYFTPTLIGLRPAGKLAPRDSYLPTIDKAVGQACRRGNVIMTFHDFSTVEWDDGDFLYFAYYRACYSAYPKRVFACEDEEPFLPSTLIRMPFSPDTEWCTEHHVVSEIRVTANGRGRCFEVVDIPLQAGNTGESSGR